MARATFDHVGKRFGSVVALEDFTVAVRDGELLAVLGPSGCGKSTLLRLTAGLETPSEGSIHLDERRIDGLPPQARDVAMVFQSYALYPHMTVRQNIEFPLRMRGLGRSERRRPAEEVAALLELPALLERRPRELSGGERQRVALARALVAEPTLLVCDEVTSALDVSVQAAIVDLIAELQREMKLGLLFVTHNLALIRTIAEEVAVMSNGRIVEHGKVDDVLDSPQEPYTRSLLNDTPSLEAALAAAGQA
jgi:ABC-type sugar transport system ATPase subunit